MKAKHEWEIETLEQRWDKEANIYQICKEKGLKAVEKLERWRVVLVQGSIWRRVRALPCMDTGLLAIVAGGTRPCPFGSYTHYYNTC